MDEKLQINANKNYIHPFYVSVLPVLFIWVFVDRMIGDMALFYELTIFPPFYVLILLLTAFSEMVIGNMLKKERIDSIVPRLREIVFVLAIAGLLILLFHGDLFSGNIPFQNVRFWLPLLIVLIQWLLSFYIHSQLHKREMFLGVFSGKDEADCKSIYNEFNHESGESLSGLHKIRRLILFFMIFGFLDLVIMTWILKIPYNRAMYNAVAAFFFLALFLITHLNNAAAAQYSMMDGLVTDRKQRSSRLWLGIIVMIVLAFALNPAVGDQSPLPTSHLTDFLEWVRNLNTRTRAVRERMDVPEIRSGIQEEDLDDYLERVTNVAAGDRRSGNFAKYIGYIMGGALGVGFLLFLFVPLVRKRESGGIKPGEMIRTAIFQIKSAFTQLKESIRRSMDEFKRRRKVAAWNRSAHRTEQTTTLAQRLRERVIPKKTTRERRIQNKYLKSFFRYTKWGTKQGVRFRTSLGPLEYSRQIAAGKPELAPQCIRIAEIFEEIMYSNHQVTEQNQSDYFDTIKQIIRN